MEEEPPTKPNMVPAIGQEVLTLDTDWCSPIIDFIKNNKSYPKGKEHKKLARRSSKYVIIGTKLFKHSASSGTLRKCITQDEGIRLLSDIHSGICGNHTSASTLVEKAFRSGFYWPTALADARNIDSHIFVAIDKFTKWIEVKLVTATTAVKAAEFIEEISHRFGVQCHVERANGLILQGLKARIFDPIKKYGAKWLQKLPRVVWGLRTQRSRASGYSPFFMVYGFEAVLPSDIAFGAPRTQNYNENKAEATRCTDINSAEEHCLTASMQHARYEQQLRRYHNHNVHERDFNVGDLVL
ncbi:uncharacterized protein LOC120669154 [Panicum virgatum]|uniref:uncharacterized protein LOC120669154 n=1 Tax=Panicum virgatum TaxID=38727 RepID=UPI0019D5DC94|nr:uncharacterized protein LOC120669154 [Panicum virgatum]